MVFKLTNLTEIYETYLSIKDALRPTFKRNKKKNRITPQTFHTS